MYYTFVYLVPWLLWWSYLTWKQPWKTSLLICLSMHEDRTHWAQRFQAFCPKPSREHFLSPGLVLSKARAVPLHCIISSIWIKTVARRQRLRGGCHWAACLQGEALVTVQVPASVSGLEGFLKGLHNIAVTWATIPSWAKVNSEREHSSLKGVLSVYLLN